MYLCTRHDEYEGLLCQKCQEEGGTKYAEILDENGKIKRFIWKRQSLGNYAWTPLPNN